MRAASRPIRLTPLLLVLTLAAVACGPRFDRSLLVEDPLAGGQPPADGSATTGDEPPATTTGTSTGSTAPTTGASTGAPLGTTGTSSATSGTTTGSTTTGTTGATGSSSTATSSTGSTGDGSATTGDGSATATTGAAPVEPGPAPGVTDDTIKIGYLVPLTGAAPIPTTWDEGARLYWEWKAGKGGTHGRNVEIIIEDTTSSTSEAVNKARKLVNDDKVFTIVTLDRLEVQESVARFLEQVGMPHVMVQSPANPPADWTNTFTVSIDHAVQGAAIATFMADELGARNGGEKVAFVREQTNALKPGTDAFESAAAGLGLDIVYDGTIDPNATDFSGTVSDLESSEADIVWLYMAPTPAARIIFQSGTPNGYEPIWFANSISWNFELMHAVTGGHMDGAYAFSPWVPLSHPATATYKAAWQDCSGCDGDADDIGLVGWGIGGVIDAALQAAGPTLGWNIWRNTLRTLEVDTDVWVPIDFTGGGSVGTRSVEVFVDRDGAWQSFKGARNY